MIKYKYGDVEYHTLWELTSATGMVIPTDVSDELLEATGITKVESPDPEPEPVPIEHLREEKDSEIAEALDRAQQSSQSKFKSSLGFEVNGNVKAERDINGYIRIMRNAPKEQEIPFRGFDNKTRMIKVQDLETLLDEVCLYGQALQQRKWELDTALAQATTAEEIQAIHPDYSDVYVDFTKKVEEETNV